MERDMENGLSDKENRNFNIIFVCTGNTCRSCMAEGIFRAVSGKNEGVSGYTAISRGIYAFDGDSASEHSIKALKTLWDIDISLHKAKLLNPTDVSEADLLLTMTRGHRDTLRAKYPDKQSSIFTLKEYAYPELNPNSNAMDIMDPFGMPYPVYESCAKEIFECIKIIFDRLS